MATSVSMPNAAPPSLGYVNPYLIVIATAAGGVLLATLWGAADLWRIGTRLDVTQTALLVALAASAFVVLRNLLLFDWRGQRVALAPDEALVFLALVALPLPLVVLFPIPAMAIFQVTTKRPFLKGAFNVATVTLAGGAGVASFVFLRAFGTPELLAAGLALVPYTVMTHLLVSGVFALRENMPVHRVFGERFWIPSMVHVIIGSCGGFAIVALWSIHPAATLVLIPFVFFAREHARLVARTDREAQMHKKLRETMRGLVGERDVGAVADRVVRAAGEVLHAGRVEMVVGQSDREQRFARDFEDGPRAGGRALAARLSTKDGEVTGALIVHPTSRTQEEFTEVDAALLDIVAEETSSAIANLRALRELDGARAHLEALLAEREAGQAALLAQRVSRPLVRRIVRGLMLETHADELVLMRIGEQLAAGVQDATLDAALKAYAEMGLGSFRVLAADGGRHEFRGEELLERTERSRATTCYLALGFLRGAVGRAHAAPARGAEITCVSRGDAECRFVIHATPGLGLGPAQGLGTTTTTSLR